MPIIVRFMKLDRDGNDTPVGSLVFDGTSIIADPPSPVLAEILATPIIVYDGKSNRAKVSASDDPTQFMTMLPYNYHSPYFGCSKPEETE